MTTLQKNEIIIKVVSVLNEMLDTDLENAQAEIKEPKEQIAVSNEINSVEMLTIRECSEIVSGLSAHTVRKLVNQDKIPAIRSGEGKRGKILIYKTALLDYLKNSV